MKPHVYRELVNDLTKIAREYHGHGCLRELINRRLAEDVKIDKTPKTTEEKVYDL
ncbi:hypothetical protein NCTGTJJY_CDS0220 [Serratia phage 92A1]|nr:hypothetical protein NCTGTJJY_CDS0220 [Serratia phage 92A1]